MFLMRTPKILLLGFYMIILGSADVSALTGNDWNRLTQGEQHSYVMGVVDVWVNIAALSSELKNYRPGTIESLYISHIECSQKKMPYIQMIEIVNEFMKDNPSEWHYEMSSLISNAIGKACGTMK